MPALYYRTGDETRTPVDPDALTPGTAVTVEENDRTTTFRVGIRRTNSLEARAAAMAAARATPRGQEG